jgi:hypothetical protein
MSLSCNSQMSNQAKTRIIQTDGFFLQDLFSVLVPDISLVRIRG